MPSPLDRRQRQRRIDERRGALVVVKPIHVLLHDERCAAVELFVLRMAAAKFGAEEVP